MIAQKLTGGVFRGEWKPGYPYQVSFLAGGTMAAQVRVMDDDATRTVRDLPARVALLGNNVELHYLQGDRIDRLVYNSDGDELDGQSAFHGGPLDRLRARRVGAGSAGAPAAGVNLKALLPEYAWTQSSPTIFIGRGADGVLVAVCANAGDGGQDALFAGCAAALGEQLAQAPTSAALLTWSGYSTFKAVGPNSGDLMVVLGRDNAAIMDQSVKVYKAMAQRPSW